MVTCNLGKLLCHSEYSMALYQSPTVPSSVHPFSFVLKEQYFIVIAFHTSVLNARLTLSLTVFHLKLSPDSGDFVITSLLFVFFSFFLHFSVNWICESNNRELFGADLEWSASRYTLIIPFAKLYKLINFNFVCQVKHQESWVCPLTQSLAPMPKNCRKFPVQPNAKSRYIRMRVFNFFSIISL